MNIGSIVLFKAEDRHILGTHIIITVFIIHGNKGVGNVVMSAQLGNHHSDKRLAQAFVIAELDVL